MVDQSLENQNSLPELALRPYPSDPQARTGIGGELTTLYFVNELPEGCIAYINKIDDQGNRAIAAEAKGPGDSYSLVIPTYPHQPWEVVFSDPEKTATRIYYAAPYPSRVMLNADISPVWNLAPMDAPNALNVFSPNEGAYTTIKFENHLQTNVKIFSVDSVGTLIPHETIYPGASSIQSTYVGCFWEVFSEYAASPFVLFSATPHGGIANIGDRPL